MRRALHEAFGDWAAFVSALWGACDGVSKCSDNACHCACRSAVIGRSW